MITPPLAFAQIFQLKGYGKYEMHGSIVNVLTNLNLVQTILFQLPCDDCSIAILLKAKSQYKSIYMLAYVHLNMMMKTLQELCQTPLYKIVKFSIR